jgi:hypothetical protein
MEMIGAEKQRRTRGTGEWSGMEQRAKRERVGTREKKGWEKKSTGRRVLLRMGGRPLERMWLCLTLRHG